MRASNLFPALALFTVAGLLAGCQGSEDEGGVPEKPPVAFEGKTDPRFEGKWKTADGKSTYDIRRDGTYSFNGKVSTQGGTFDNKFEGAWLIKEELMLFKDGQGNVVPYKFTLDGNKLTLALTGSLKRESVLTRS